MSIKWIRTFWELFIPYAIIIYLLHEAHTKGALWEAAAVSVMALIWREILMKEFCNYLACENW